MSDQIEIFTTSSTDAGERFDEVEGKSERERERWSFKFVGNGFKDSLFDSEISNALFLVSNQANEPFEKIAL